MSATRIWIVLGALLGGTAVGCGAFAAHGLESRLLAQYEGQVYERKIATATGPRVIETVPLARKYLTDFETGARYQMYHALALIGLGLAPLRNGCRRRTASGWFFLLGVLGFSGGLYVYTLLQQKWVGMTIVPLGGVCFIVGWGLFAWAALHPQDGSNAR